MEKSEIAIKLTLAAIESDLIMRYSENEETAEEVAKFYNTVYKLIESPSSDE